MAYRRKDQLAFLQKNVSIGITLRSQRCAFNLRDRIFKEVGAINPLLVLWLLVFSSAVILSVAFYLAENYPHIIGNFYFLTGTFFVVYLLYAAIARRRREPPRE